MIGHPKKYESRVGINLWCGLWPDNRRGLQVLIRLADLLVFFFTENFNGRDELLGTFLRNLNFLAMVLAGGQPGGACTKSRFE